jgi:MFS family permease
MKMPTGEPTGLGSSNGPRRAGLVLVALILVAAVANLNLAVANVALPSIGAAFDASQTALDLVAVGYSLGLAASVLYLGALGDRYGRKMMLVLGVLVSVPACLLAAFTKTVAILVVARVLGGLSAGMAFPTTLALITALWSGQARTRSIALWSGAGGAIASVGPLTSGWLLEHFWWGSVFLITLPLAAVALVMAVVFVPSGVNETRDPVDHLGGVLSVLLVAALVLAINFAAAPNRGALTLGLTMTAAAAGVAFFLRQHRAKVPLYDLHVAMRRIFWVAAGAGTIVFGTLMGAMFIGQQFLQNALGYSTLDAGLAILPAAFFMVLVAPHSATLVNARGARFTLLTGYLFCLLGFLTMLVLWKEGIPDWKVGLGYAFIGIGVGFAGTPASHSLTGSVPVDRAGMASGTADLQRDLGGAIMQSIFGALLTFGYAAAVRTSIAGAPSADAELITDNVARQLQKSFAGAAEIAQRYPQYASRIIAAAKSAFLSGDQAAYAAGIGAIVLGAVLVFFFFPKKDEEERMLAEYHLSDTPRLRGSAHSRGDPASGGNDRWSQPFRKGRANE